MLLLLCYSIVATVTKVAWWVGGSSPGVALVGWWFKPRCSPGGLDPNLIHRITQLFNAACHTIHTAGSVTICLSRSSFYLLFLYVYYFPYLPVSIHYQLLSFPLVFPSHVSVHLCDLSPSTPESVSLTVRLFPYSWYFLRLRSLLVFLNFPLLS